MSRRAVAGGLVYHVVLLANTESTSLCLNSKNIFINFHEDKA